MKDNIVFMRDAENAYRNGKPIITDDEWDVLVKKYKYKENIGETNTIDKKSASGRNIIPMNNPLVSLRKVYDNKEDLYSFINGLKNKNNIIIEPKLDGNAFNAQYKINEDGTAYLIHVGSSGDGENSIECFEHALDFVNISGLPDKINDHLVTSLKNKGLVVNNLIEVRGEVIINKDVWTFHNYGQDFTNFSWRSTVAGIMNRKEPASMSYLISLLTEGTFNLKDKTDNLKVFKKYGLVNSIKKYLNSNDVTVEVKNKDVSFYSNDNPNNVKLLDNCMFKLIPFGSKLNIRKEFVTFITYSISSEEGNVDHEFLYSDEFKSNFITFDEVDNFDEIEDSEMCITRIKLNDVSDETLEKLVLYSGKFFGNKDWNPDSDKEIRKMSRFICDGIVIKENCPDEGIYRTKNIAHHPVNRLAIKLTGKKYRVHLDTITEDITEKGNHTMHGKLNPPVTTDDGSVITNINLHNPDWLKRNEWIKENSDYDMVMSADLIPVLYEIK